MNFFRKRVIDLEVGVTADGRVTFVAHKPMCIKFGDETYFIGTFGEALTIDPRVVISDV